MITSTLRMISAFLAFVLILNLTPASAFAAPVCIDVFSPKAMQVQQSKKMAVARAVYKRLKAANKITSRILLISTLVAFGMSSYSVWQANQYFEDTLNLETGLTGEDQELYERILNESGFKSEDEALSWLAEQYSNDPRLRKFVDDLEQELQQPIKQPIQIRQP